jgi:3-oxoacyl-[acyl-carrier-protein] synthase-3
VLDRELRGRSWAIERLAYEIADIEQPAGQHVAYRGIREGEGQMVREDYKAIERLVPELAAELTTELQRGVQKIDWFLPPQLSGRMTQLIIRKLGLPKERCLNCVHRTGNNGNALPFLQLAMLNEAFSPGEHALGIAIESSRWMRGGYVISNQMN